MLVIMLFFIYKDINFIKIGKPYIQTEKAKHKRDAINAQRHLLTDFLRGYIKKKPYLHCGFARSLGDGTI